MKIRVVPFEAWHYIAVFRTTVQFTTAVGLPDPATTGLRFESDGPAWTGLDEDNDVVGCAGVLIPWQGYGVGWAMLDARILAWPIRDRVAVHRIMAAHFEDIITHHDLQRVEANVDLGLPVAVRWIQAMGFEKESEMPRYRNGQTYGKFVRLR